MNVQTPRPTPRRAGAPTPKPTVRPTDTSCDYGFDVALGIVLANGSLWEEKIECDNAREYLLEVVESIMKMRCSILTYFLHEWWFISMSSGTRNDKDNNNNRNPGANKLSKIEIAQLPMYSKNSKIRLSR